MSIFQRIRDVAFNPELKLLPHVHVLDLAKTGYVQLPDLNATINCKKNNNKSKMKIKDSSNNK